MAAQSKAPDTSDRELVISREYNAPLALVWKAWTEPQHLAQWFGPNGFSITTFEMNFKPGGIWRFTMHGPDGQDYKNRVNYIEIVPQKKIVYSQGGEEAHADIQFHVTITFTEQSGKTTVKMQSVFPTKEQFEKVVREHGAIEGAKQHVARLADYLPKMADAKAAPIEKAFVFARELNAPRSLVWKAWTEGARLAHWWGPRGMKLEVLKADVQPGGKFHYSMEPQGGAKMWGIMAYREINPEGRIVWVNSFANEKGEIARAPYSPLIPLEMHNTLLLEEKGGKTRLTLRSAPINASKEECAFFEGMFEGMEGGFSGTFEQLAAYLAGATK